MQKASTTKIGILYKKKNTEKPVEKTPIYWVILHPQWLN